MVYFFSLRASIFKNAEKFSLYFSNSFLKTCLSVLERVHSIGHIWLDLGLFEARSHVFLGLPCCFRSPSTWTSSAAFPGALTGTWIGIGTVGTRTSTHMGYKYFKQMFNLCQPFLDSYLQCYEYQESWFNFNFLKNKCKKWFQTEGENLAVSAWCCFWFCLVSRTQKLNGCFNFCHKQQNFQVLSCDRVPNSMNSHILW